MHILAIETSTATAEVALALADRPIRTAPLRTDLRHGRDLVPCVQRLLREQGWRPADVEGVAVSLGPGSYTGLRVGLMCAKAFAYATQARLVGVDSLQAVAANVDAGVPQVLVVADAQRGELYCARYRIEQGMPVPQAPVRILSLTDAMALADPDTVVAGPGLHRYASDIAESGAHLAPEPQWVPRAEWVARLGWAQFEQGHTLDVHTAEPIYLRRPAAVDQWERLHGAD